MGMDFTAYFSHDLSTEQIKEICHRINSERGLFPIIHNFVDELLLYYPEDRDKVWSFDPDGIGGTNEIYGPCGFSFTFSDKVCYFHHYIRWGAFLTDEVIQYKLRKVCYELRKLLNSSFVIYVPDSAVKESVILDFIWDDQNKDLNYIKNWLLINCGSPKENIKDIYKVYDEFWDSEGYYIDSFIDFEVDS